MLDYEITVQNAASLLKEGKAKLIDVREPWEFSAAHADIDSAVLMPMGDIPTRAHQELDPEDHLLILCHHGARSLSVTNWLRQQGFDSAQSIAGGIDAWSLQVDSTVPPLLSPRIHAFRIGQGFRRAAPPCLSSKDQLFWSITRGSRPMQTIPKLSSALSAHREPTMGVTAFKAQCLALIEDVIQGKADRVILLKHNRPVAALVPLHHDANGGDELWGAMRGTISIQPGVDLTEPTGELWDAEV